MKLHNKFLQNNAKNLRKNLTAQERKLWHSIRNRQVLNVKFLRQKILSNYIVDFYSAEIKLVIELDGGQHYDTNNILKDKRRDIILSKYGITVLRFTNLDINLRFNSVMDVIYNEIEARRNELWCSSLAVNSRINSITSAK
jgi:very-short-patch-repair endonuclease